MQDANALNELNDLLNQADREIEAIKRSFNQTGNVDILITTQAMRTLHTIKGLTGLCSLKTAARITHLLETLIDQIAKNRLTPNDNTMDLLSDGISLLVDIVRQGEEKTSAASETLIKKLEVAGTAQEQAAPKTSEISKQASKPVSQTIDYHALGLEEEDLIQLSDTEKLSIEQTFAKERPVVGYLAHVNIETLEQEVKAVSNIIGENGTLITLVPTHSKLPQFSYAFVFIFTSAAPSAEFEQRCTLPGKITWLSKGQPAETFFINYSPKTNPVLDQKSTRQEQPIPVPTQAAQDKKPEQRAQPRKPTFAGDRAPEPTKVQFDMIEQMRWAKKEDPILHIPISKIDTLIDQNNKLISCKIKLERCIKQLKSGEKSWQPLLCMEEQVSLLEKHLKLSQQAILKARLVAVETVFGDIGRIIKNIAQESGKKIEFELIGKEVEVDKVILEGLQNPLIHLIKNAADHAIKSPEERIAAGKSPEGNIRITFAQQADRVLVTVQDDGQGLDVQAIRKKALEKELVDPVTAANMSDTEIYQFIFIPGFSTKEQLTETSGRGIGMNTVKSAVEKMHGELFLESQPGVGTKFVISISSFLSLQRLLRFSVDGQNYALPFTSIVEVIPFDKDLLQSMDDKMLFMFHGKPLQAFALGHVLGIDAQHELEYHNVIIVQHLKKTCALLVNQIIGQEELIARPLDMPDTKEFALYAGHADFGDDKLVLIINIDKLWEHLHEK